MNKKFVARLLSVALAMTMVLGSSLTALADPVPNECTCGKRSDSDPWYSVEYTHYRCCQNCHGSYDVGEHDTYTSLSNGNHRVTCTKCGSAVNWEEPCTFNSEGRCTKCNYSDSSKSDQAAKEAEIAAK